MFDIRRKDVRLPQQLQRAMAAEAEASREARAKVSLKLLKSSVPFRNPEKGKSFSVNKVSSSSKVQRHESFCPFFSPGHLP